MEKIMQLKTIKEYNDYMGVETRHPLVSVIEGSRMPHPVPHARKHVGMYVVFLKELRCTDDLTYGRRSYDFQENTLVFIAPGQVFGHEADGTTFTGSGWCLLFHPDLLRGTPLGRHMQDYTFFSYAANEALHLSKQEQQTVIDCLTKIDEETYDKADRHSNLIIASAIELLLNYCLRFYERQFITRQDAHHDILTRFETFLDQYFTGDNAAQKGLPSVKHCASELCLSTNYFGDLIKKETGRTALEYIQDKIISIAKEQLLLPSESISQIAYQLGFQYPQHFTRVFKKATGMTPNEYRSKTEYK